MVNTVATALVDSLQKNTKLIYLCGERGACLNFDPDTSTMTEGCVQPNDFASLTIMQAIQHAIIFFWNEFGCYCIMSHSSRLSFERPSYYPYSWFT